MSGVVNEFDANNIRYSKAEGAVYLTGQLIKDSVFRYSILCPHTTQDGYKMWFFFNLQNWQCLIVLTGISGVMYRCYLLKFWLENDLPVLSVNLFMAQKTFIEAISTSFREQHAGLLLDDIINS